MGWAELENGELLKAAEGSYDAFITTDQKPALSSEVLGEYLSG
jgi:hypothetical protein